MKKIVFLIFIFTLSILGKEVQTHHKKAILWLDAYANFKRLGTEQGVDRILKKAKETGFTDVVVDLKNIDGYVLYPSKIAPRLMEHKGFKRSADYNYPAVVLKEGHKLGLGVYFSINVFAEGAKKTKVGLAYSKHPEWQTMVYTKKGIIPTAESGKGITVFVNPLLPAVRKYEFSIIREILEMYKPDGFILDRARYPDMSGGFGKVSKKAFEKFLGKTVKNWPQDVYTLVTDSAGKEKRDPGPYYKKWLEWRCKVIHDFFYAARDTIKSIRPNIQYSNYVGAWYPIYYDVGANWASNKYHTSKDYDWADSTYYKTGYAEALDFLMVGNYFYDITEKEAIKSHTPSPDPSMKPSDYWWYSVIGSAKIAYKVVEKSVPVLGSLYVRQYADKKNPQQFVKATKEVLKLTDGIMIFDVVHIEENHWWNYMKEALSGN